MSIKDAIDFINLIYIEEYKEVRLDAIYKLI